MQKSAGKAIRATQLAYDEVANSDLQQLEWDLPCEAFHTGRFHKDGTEFLNINGIDTYALYVEIRPIE